ncbi:MAG: two-component system response regulator CreB [Candidatus Competibacteraceae bacterium]|nr:two-component system response regulator CreB [Candidatus Competibacteraceae bacterium]MCB1822516.1 two-component system response regulator CreB [Candidatus Competibacteraceae bacterium]
MTAHILLIEDEPSIAEVVEFALTSEGFQVSWRTLVREAEAELAKGSCDLLILDLGLPDGSGLELLKRLRRSSEIPTLILSARNAELDRVLGLELGADDYVTKPFSPRELAARVKAILKRTVRNPPVIDQATVVQGVCSAWFEIDEVRAAIRFHNQTLDLTRYEYLLLKTLLAQPERVFSRGQLMDQVWPDPTASFERSVDTHIKTLRAKLREIAPTLDPIRTHRGLGYSVRIHDDS